MEGDGSGSDEHRYRPGEQEYFMEMADEEELEAFRQEPPEAALDEQDEEIWIDEQAAEQFQDILYRERHGVEARPLARDDEVMAPDDQRLDQMLLIQEQIAAERGIDIWQLEGGFNFDPETGALEWVDLPQGEAVRRSGTMGRFNKRIRRGGNPDDEGPGF